MIQIEWKILVTLPFTTSISKNRAKTIHHAGKYKRIIGLTAAYKEAKTLFTLAFQQACDVAKPQWVEKEKVWLDILVVRPNLKSDPINLLDGIADALKEAIPIDDRYYAIHRLDHTRDKENPAIHIKVGQ